MKKYIMIIRKIKMVLLLGLMLDVNPQALAEITFGPNVRVDDTGLSTSGQYDPSIAVDASGRVFITWADRRSNPYTSDIYIARSIDEGNSFGMNIRIDNADIGSSFYPSIVTDVNGNIYVAWYESRVRGGIWYDYIYFAKSTDSGDSFGENTRVDDTGNLDNSRRTIPAIAVYGDEDIYIVWPDCRNGFNNDDIYFAKSTDGGNTFGTNVRVDDTGSLDSMQYDPSITVDTNGNIYVAWSDKRNGRFVSDIYFAKSNDGGTSFSPNIRVDDSDAGASSNSPSIATTLDGDIYIVWEESDYENGNFYIYFVKSTDGGNTFGTKVRVDDTAVTNILKSAPSITVASNGDIYTAWHDARNGNFDIYFAKSTDGGNTFGTNVRVDDTGTTISYQVKPSLSTTPEGDVCIAWEDSRNGNPDIYFAKGAEANNPPVLDPIGNKIADENQLIEFGITATDPNGDSLTYEAQNLPSGATFDATIRTFSWTPTYDQAGSYDVGFLVSDGELTDSEIVTITVNDIPVPDMIISRMWCKVEGREVTALAIIENIGEKKTGEFYTEALLDGQVVGRKTVTNIPVGKKRELRFRFKANRGKHTVTVVVDPQNTIPELWEDNNQAERVIYIKK